jgi:hypothetical protein
MYAAILNVWGNKMRQRHFVLSSFAYLTLMSLCCACRADPISGNCVAPENGGFYRDISGLDGAHFWFSGGNSSVSMCVVMSDCYWRLTGTPSVEFGKLSNYANGEPCGADKEWRRIDGVFVWRSDCKLDEETENNIDTSVTWLREIAGAREKHCGTSPVTPLDHLASIINTELGTLVVVQVPMNNFCLIISVRIKSQGSGALILPQCLESREDVIALVSRDKEYFNSNRIWIGADSTTGGFAISLPSLNSGEGERRYHVWGKLVEPYVLGWLRSIAAAASANTVLADDDLLPSADRKSFFGRLSKWLAAGLVRIKATPFRSGLAGWDNPLSRAARNWMARNSASGETVFLGTLLRGELAVKDWRS